MISMIAAIADNGVIGRNNRIPWHLPDDLLRFRTITRHHIVIMGRKTYESLGKLLDDRIHIVLSHTMPSQESEGLYVVSSLADAHLVLVRLESTHPGKQAFVIGGADIYRQFMPWAAWLYLTWVRSPVPGDTVFPKIPWTEFFVIDEQHHPADDRHVYPFTYCIYKRRR